MRKRLWCGMLAALLCIGMLCGTTTPAAAAENSSDSYTYDAEGNSQATPAPYQMKAVIWGAEAFGGVPLKNPRDFFVDDDHNIYILDGENNRIVMLDQDYTSSKPSLLPSTRKRLTFPKPPASLSTGSIYTLPTKSRPPCL